MAPNKVKEAGRLVKNYARYQTQRAVAKGELKRPKKCSKCRREGLQIHAHHPNYFKPLKVRWLCRDCHHLVHSPTGWQQYKFDGLMDYYDLLEKEYKGKKEN